MLQRSALPGYVGTRAKPVEQVDVVTGRVIACYASVTEASKVTKVNLGHVCEVARGERKRAGGYSWRYVRVEDGKEEGTSS